MSAAHRVMFFFRAVIIFILFKIGSSYVRKVVFLSSSISRRRIDTCSSFPSSPPSWGLQIIQQHGNTISSYNRNFNDNRYVPSKNRFSKGDKSEVIKQVDKVLAACKGHSSIKLNGITEVNHAIVSAGRLGRTEDAIEIFRSLKGLGFSPDLMSFFFFFFFLILPRCDKRGLVNGGSMFRRCPRLNLGPTRLYSVHYCEPL